MLSYRHQFHAGSHADVLKHLVLVYVIEYLKQKDKPFLYLDTHAGAGRYDLSADHQHTNKEFQHGIARLLDAPEPPEALLPYLDFIKYYNPGGLLHYPGSPEIAGLLLRPQDRIACFELHPADYQSLSDLLSHRKNTTISQSDGFAGLKALLPPMEKRAVVLIDPSYEIKKDYSDVVTALQQAYKRFATGVYLLWYPVVERERINQLSRAITQSGFKEVLQTELLVAEDSDDFGMTGSGMIVINPPFQLKEHLESVLPFVKKVLGVK